MPLKKILYVPAWFPASFFEEQQAVTDICYERYVLLGSVVCVPPRKLLRHPSWIKPKVQTHQTRILITHYYFKFKSRFLQKVQMRYGAKIFEKIFDGWFGGKIPDVVNFQSVSMFSIFVSDWAKLKGIPIVVTEHLIRYPEKDILINERKLDVYRSACAVNCVSNYVLRSLLVTGIPVKNFSVIGNLLDFKYTSSSQKIPNSIIFVASHPYDKGINTFIEVAKLLRTTSWHIDWFGVDESSILEDYGVVRDLICESGIENIVSVKGRVSHKELLEKYSCYTMLLSTSFSETFGLAVAEAIMSKVPVVCTDSGGIRDFVDESNGIIVPIGDSEAAVKAISTLTSMTFDMDSASKKLLNKYSIDCYSKKVISVFDNSLRR